jgi:hypothetical protein
LQDGGPSALTDPEVLHLVKNKHIAPYQLEGALNDPLRGVHIRRILYEQAMLPSLADGLRSIPYTPFDYDLVIISSNRSHFFLGINGIFVWKMKKNEAFKWTIFVLD